MLPWRCYSLKLVFSTQWLRMVYYRSFLLKSILVQKHLGFPFSSAVIPIAILMSWKLSLSLSSFLGTFCAIISGILPVDILGETASISALITYFFVHIEVMLVRQCFDILSFLNWCRLFLDAFYTSRYAANIPSSIRFLACSDSRFITLYNSNVECIESNSLSISGLDRSWSNLLFFLRSLAFEKTSTSTDEISEQYHWISITCVHYYSQ